MKPSQNRETCMPAPVSGEQHGVFEELADSLHLWTKRLHRKLVQEGIEHVFFLSREGQPLKRMFDAYMLAVGGQTQSHYLEVSRRSTLLPSLQSLDVEEFETLFRQYRAISLAEFLSSLGLDEEIAAIAEELSLEPGEASVRLDDFPSSPLFARLRSNPVFRTIYETRRVAQREAFLDYLRELTGAPLPGTLAIVDVGWKGTIQDNLHAMLCGTGDAGIDHVVGFYVGLVASGSAGPTNTKHGLLFSHVDGWSPGFQVFNENKSLFEVVLAADHGSVVGYGRDPDGKGRPVHGTFDEGDMLKTSVFPVLAQVEKRFAILVGRDLRDADERVPAVVDAHARMVFHPSRTELEWFDSIFHVENYGFFERSYFGQVDGNPPLGERLRFLYRIFQRKNFGELGFWPWATLYRRAGKIPARGYAMIRKWQARRGVR